MRIRLKFRLDDQVVYGCFSSVQRIGSTNSSAVLYTPQELTEDEKSQARENIGVQDPNLLVVTVDANDKASHTASEINTFVQGGGSAVLVWFSNVFQAKIIGASRCQFGAIFNATTGATEWLMDVDAKGMTTFSDVVLDSLKNPNPITFAGAVEATYDGSKPVEIEIPTPQTVDIPEKLPNPHAITFTGAVEATYDGSHPVEVEIPEGGGGNSVYFSEEEPADAQTGDFWYDESEGDVSEGVIGGGGASITVDDALSPDSTNPVQNKVIFAYLEEATNVLEQIQGSIPSDDHINELIDAKLGVIENGTY